MQEEPKGKLVSCLIIFSGMALENPGGTNDLMNLAREETGNEARKAGDREEIPVKVTLWKNGFQIEGGEFRDYEEPKNKKFMEEMKASKVP